MGEAAAGVSGRVASAGVLLPPPPPPQAESPDRSAKVARVSCCLIKKIAFRKGKHEHY